MLPKGFSWHPYRGNGRALCLDGFVVATVWAERGWYQFKCLPSQRIGKFVMQPDAEDYLERWAERWQRAIRNWLENCPPRGEAGHPPEGLERIAERQ